MLKTFNDIASACFLNSLQRESSSLYYVTQPEGSCHLHIPLEQDKYILVPVHYFSSLGISEYRWPAFLISGQERVEISFRQVVEIIINNKKLVGDQTNSNKLKFIERVMESHANTHAAISRISSFNSLFDGALKFENAEQGLLAGHSVHPAPKSREQFSEEDASLFTPEFQSCFPLRWFAVSRQLVLKDSAGKDSATALLGKVLAVDNKLRKALLGKIPEGFCLFPVHPWQSKVLLKRADIKEYIKNNQLIDLGDHGTNWLPTSSTRSLYSPGLPLMLKFSLSVKLTNSIRTMSEKEVRRGLRLKTIVEADEFQAKTNKYTGFTIMQEPAFLGIIGIDGKVIEESLVSLRDNVIKDTPEQEAVVLATLCQQHPTGKNSLLASRVSYLAKRKSISLSEAALKWFEQYCQHAVVPLFDMQANHGIVFLAHQQNIVMKLEDGLPVGMYFRDCQGTGYTDIAYKLYPEYLIDDAFDRENYWDESKVKRYFPYYLIINSTYNVISALASRCNILEESLINILRNSLKSLRADGVNDRSCLNYVLDSPTLCCKGNFFCYLQNLNENSIPEPSVIYFDLPNPLFKEKDKIFNNGNNEELSLV
ncbi:aerobactin siderophore biosynthesis protein IucA [Photobacterium sp. SKA34]|uniref:IucA/IucC family protein n=1 Tax=Photobacterium sp. SKA34 TaxID=121723 RepID=UPI00006B89BD|nr:IucA/IucC family protein [Photobacterium sp. SKA34]EAR55203.1 aerobactin siderophore biosynthesis protein IucA [Photobacterium sp. SKA34]